MKKNQNYVSVYFERISSLRRCLVSIYGNVMKWANMWFIFRLDRLLKISNIFTVLWMHINVHLSLVRFSGSFFLLPRSQSYVQKKKPVLPMMCPDFVGRWAPYESTFSRVARTKISFIRSKSVPFADVCAHERFFLVALSSYCFFFFSQNGSIWCLRFGDTGHKPRVKV